MKDHILPALAVATLISTMFSVGLVRATISPDIAWMKEDSISCEQLQQAIDDGALKLERK